MPKPLFRGGSRSGGGAGLIGVGNGRETLDYNSPSKDLSGSTSRSKVDGTAYLLFKFGLALIVVLAVFGSLYWTISISASSSRVNIFRGYRRLQEQLVTDLSEIGELSLGVVKLKDIRFCSSEYENYVPCYYNVSDYYADAAGDLREIGGSDVDPTGAIEQPKRDPERMCLPKQNESESCLVLSPLNYRIPIRWPTGRDFIWKENVEITGHEFSSGSLTKRMMVEEEQISFHSESLMVNGVEDYSHQIAEMIGLKEASCFNEGGIRNVLDIDCGFGSFGGHLFSKHLLTTCIANYEFSASQVQLTLERGLPAVIGSFGSKQLPFPHLSFDMVHCTRCGIDWETKDGIFLVEVDRLLKPGGYFVWTSQSNTLRTLGENQKKSDTIRGFAKNLCWEVLSQQDETTIWKKGSDRKCYSKRKSGPGICGKSKDVESLYYQPLHLCIAGTRSTRWVSIENMTPWPNRVRPNSSELKLHGVQMEDFSEDAIRWNSIVRNYWSLLSPLIFSDHPKRPGEEDPSPPFNMLRNVLDMNARFGGFNAALLDSGKSVWVMNVVPAIGPNHLPLILDRGFIGIQHDWCEAFPTYPRTYDMVHAHGLLSLETRKRCSMFNILLEIDRILRPEGWVILRDSGHLIETARYITTQMKWDARLIQLDIKSDERLLICQKPFFKKS